MVRKKTTGNQESVAGRGRNRLSATEAARRFSDMVNRVVYNREAFLVERGGRAVCEVRPVYGSDFTGADLVALLRRLPSPGEPYLEAVEKAIAEQSAAEPTRWPR